MNGSKTAVVVGASSGIGLALAKLLINEGYRVGITGRRELLLQKNKQILGENCITQCFDVSDTQESIAQLEVLINKLGGLDLFIISAGIGFINPNMAWDKEEQTIAVNVNGFAALANFVGRYFIQQKHGILVGISSIGALRGNGVAPAYNASKAFVSNYLEGLRHNLTKKEGDFTVCTIEPGFVDTEMAKGETPLKKIPVDKAAKQILDAIIKRKSHAYISKRWRLFAWLYRSLPDFIFLKM